MGYVVTAPLVIVKDLSGAEPGPDVYLYQGATLPDFVTAEQRKQLEGLIDKADTPKAATAKKTAAKKTAADKAADKADEEDAKK